MNSIKTTYSFFLDKQNTKTQSLATPYDSNDVTKQIKQFIQPKMDLELSRIDYTLIGITESNNVKLLPSSGYKKQQKVSLIEYHRN